MTLITHDREGIKNLKLKSSNCSLQQQVKKESNSTDNTLTTVEIVKKPPKIVEVSSHRPPLNYVVIWWINGESNLETNLKRYVNLVTWWKGELISKRAEIRYNISWLYHERRCNKNKRESNKKMQFAKSHKRAGENPSNQYNHKRDHKCYQNINWRRIVLHENYKLKNGCAIWEAMPVTFSKLIEKKTVNLGCTRCISEEIEIY